MAAMFAAELNDLNELKKLLAGNTERTTKMAANSRLPKEAPQTRPFIRPRVKTLKTGKTQVKLLPMRHANLRFASLKSPKSQVPIMEAVGLKPNTNIDYKYHDVSDFHALLKPNDFQVKTDDFTFDQSPLTPSDVQSYSDTSDLDNPLVAEASETAPIESSTVKEEVSVMETQELTLLEDKLNQLL